ncbi:hypothetical protein M0412_03855 [Agrobacterium sp. O3.4]|uniref:Uncharacterized protein n=1 Tax=Agrobacterium cucumeris TaxID=2862866 RepID=A0ABY8RGZ2_9HYPH|nr:MULTISPECIES: hypothetical protein [Rhizobium/Agrobacterium group]MCZ7469807.1 hypothetical protein [Rhizobium rhizogenes]WHO06960.1 hypothetical protein KZ699_07480 [Agrobacterium cucumeris]
MSETDTDSEQNNATDVADRLCRLMRRIEITAGELRFNQPHSPTQKFTGLQCPLYQVFEPIATELEFENYAELRDNFVALCNRVIRDVSSLTLKRPETQQRWIQAAKMANGVFDARNFGIDTGSVFQKHFSQDVYQRLEDASERLQITERQEATVDELGEALNAARNTLNAYEQHGKIPAEIGRILKHYLQQIESAYQHYDDFGEEIFWATYKELFATFLQVHNVIVPSTPNDAIKTALNTMGEKMKYGLHALAVSADAATIAATGLAVLQLAKV